MLGLFAASAASLSMAPQRAAALRDIPGLEQEVGKGKYDTKVPAACLSSHSRSLPLTVPAVDACGMQMDPLVAAAKYGTGKAQQEAKRELKKRGEAVPKVQAARGPGGSYAL